MKIAKEYKRGFTLTEVIVSIAIVSIVILAVSSTFLSIRRIEKQKIARENIVSEIRNIYNIFSSEPDDFDVLIQLIQDIYPKKTVIEVENETIFLITYNSLFQPSETDYYTYTMKCKYSIKKDEQEENLTLEYTLEIELPDKFQSYIKEEALKRTIKVWGQS
jgi:prepilin-type N-terminal cleavage/methylation domain-containing protein